MDEFAKRIASLSPEVRKMLAKQLRGELGPVSGADDPIAVVGLGCRFPAGANNPSAFWQKLREGYDAITEIPADRWDIAQSFDTDSAVPGKANSRWGAFVDHVDRFDAAFFGIPPAEAAHMDPQQRLLLEIAWEALEDAGQTSNRLSGSKTGVFVGMINHSSEYYWMQTSDIREIDAYTCTGTAHSVMANRISYQFDLKGPSITVDTACSSSLVAVHMAVRSLRHRECNMALAGGVHLMLTPENIVTLSKLNMMAPDGRCKTFDSRANGFVRGEGCGLVVLKRLSDAVADNDNVLAVIRGSAVNQDGRSNGLTSPNGMAHRALIREALEDGGVAPSRISYVETHGTGTALGDPIEVEALTDVIGQPRPSGNPCFLGAVKTNIGHLEGAAGIAGLIKAVLALQHKWIPPNLHLEKLNPHLRLEGTPFVLPVEGVEWPASADKRCAGVSSFGVGGTNAHIVLEEAPTREQGREASAASLLTISARSAEALSALAQSYQDFLGHANLNIDDICYSASVRRTHLEHRLAVAGGSANALREGLAAFLEGKPSPSYSSGRVSQDRRRGLAFVFSGQGPQWFGMGRDLAAQQPVFRAMLERCDAALRKLGPWSLLQELAASEAESRLSQTEFAQPAIFAIQVALADLLRSWDIVPDAVVGHSVGEVAAAFVAGGLTFDDAIRIIFHRGRVMQRATGAGKMASVELPVSEIEEALAPYAGKLSVAAVNSPGTTVVSGDATALDEFLAPLRTRGAAIRMLPVIYAFHSPQMDPLHRELVRSLETCAPRQGIIQLYSTVAGAAINTASMDAEYWWRNVRKPVLFAAAIEKLAEAGNNILLEVSPHPVLSSAISQCRENAIVIPTLRRGHPEALTLQSALGNLFTNGCPVAWGKVSARGRLVPLPAYPWQHKRFWLEPRQEKRVPVLAFSASPQAAPQSDVQPNASQLHIATHVTNQVSDLSVTERIIREQLQIMTEQLEVLEAQGLNLPAGARKGAGGLVF